MWSFCDLLPYFKRPKRIFSRYLVSYIKPQFKILSPLLALFLLSGAIFAPFQAEASLFGLGTKVLASNEKASPTNESNSQNMDLLTPMVSPGAVVSDKKDPDIIKSDKEINVVSETALVPSTSAMGTDSDDADVSSEDITIYVVRKGDTAATIAEMFKVKVNTIYWANDLKKGDKLTEGDTLIILPTDGVKHTVLKGQTLKGIAKLYGVDVNDITSFNDILLDTSLVVGDELIIPGAEIKTTSPTKTIKQGGRLPASDKSSQRSSTGYFIKPIPCGQTQGRHDRTAVDLGCHTSGTPIKAAASGKIIFAKNGWNGAFGNLVIIQHPNGMKTYYAHQSKLNVSIGDQVSQGDIIGFVGNTGRSTGPHLHFEVRGGWNPGFDNSWASPN